MASYDEVMKKAQGHYGKPLPAGPPKPIAPKPPAPPGPKSLKRAAAPPKSTFAERTDEEQQLEPGMRPGYKNLKSITGQKAVFAGGSRGSQ